MIIIGGQKRLALPAVYRIVALLRVMLAVPHSLRLVLQRILLALMAYYYDEVGDLSNAVEIGSCGIALVDMICYVQGSPYTL